ncbi:MAG: bifunctional 2-polyprenyl-6-hydroxyphenol methylase/3-demethylubiquinol 3-O-methyltransferase UbiG [Desulfobacteraceae bacterium]|nr:MAG: bifunctional 2-polyprenyl-6-hydroxyphenol methylase/3-demethylubiquinol 3-O-methyltransferase UbiG [Desulfobacteraceae bacterium]
MARRPANVDPQELAKFTPMADLWWQPTGDFKALHDINPVRLAYVRRAGLAGKKVIDVGCGGGLLSEAMAREGAQVTGIDMVEAALGVARRHADENSLPVDYREGSAEQWAQVCPGFFDMVTCMELVEHVPDPAALIRSCAELLRPGGDLFFATVNRTPLSYLLVILAAEYLLGIVRKGTHRYNRFVRPAELRCWGEAAGLKVMDLSGLRYLPFVRHVRLCASVKMNYLMHFKKGIHNAPMAKSELV